MAGTDTAVIRLSELEHGQEADCFAALVKKETGTDRNGNPFVKCHFRDKRVVRVAPFWSSHPLLDQALGWADGQAFRLHLKGENHARYGFQVNVLDAREVCPADALDGYDHYDLVESTRFDADRLFDTIHACIDKYIVEDPLRRLVRGILADHADAFKKMPAAQNFHHSFTGGLLEHVWSITRVAGFLADHYSKYYDTLNPPLNKGVIIAAAILHDIGKLRELEYHPVEARYTTVGSLVGHVLLGRDMVREAAARIEGFPAETLLLLEHAILAHHGREEYGAPKAPMTLEALLVHYADEIDAKLNTVARERLRSTTESAFTDKIFALNNRRFYKGVPEGPPPEEPPPPSRSIG